MSREILKISDRSGKRWSEVEEVILEDLAARLTTTKVAKRLGRSISAVHHRYRDNKLSPYNNDGKFTAAEVSRETGIPLTTICQRLQKGQINGIKVGPFWRIVWDGESPLIPNWNGRVVHKSIMEEERSKGRMTCLKCERPLEGVQTVWGLQRCKGKTTRM